MSTRVGTIYSDLEMDNEETRDDQVGIAAESGGMLPTISMVELMQMFVID